LAEANVLHVPTEWRKKLGGDAHLFEGAEDEGD
jgi:hypothetical protein